MKKYTLIVLILLLFNSCDNNEALVKPTNIQIGTGTGSFIFNDYAPFINKPIEVFYHIPQNSNNNHPILISLHGSNRNGSNHLNSMISKSEQYGFILVVPEFKDDYFTGGDGYNLANIFDDGDNPSPSTLNISEEWTFSVIDPIFNYIKERTQNSSNQYNLIGFSAGGQLAHRTFIFGNSNFCKTTIAMSSGWYTTINENLDFPYGLKESPFLNSSLNSIFSKELIILIGEDDNDPNAVGLRRNSIVDLQGDNRFARAENFFLSAQNLANQEDHTFNWNKFTVTNAAHDLTPIANFAINLLYQ